MEACEKPLFHTLDTKNPEMTGLPRGIHIILAHWSVFGEAGSTVLAKTLSRGPKGVIHECSISGIFPGGAGYHGILWTLLTVSRTGRPPASRAMDNAPNTG